MMHSLTGRAYSLFRSGESRNKLERERICVVSRTHARDRIAVSSSLRLPSPLPVPFLYSNPLELLLDDLLHPLSHDIYSMTKEEVGERWRPFTFTSIWNHTHQTQLEEREGGKGRMILSLHLTVLPLTNRGRMEICLSSITSSSILSVTLRAQSPFRLEEKRRVTSRREEKRERGEDAITKYTGEGIDRSDSEPSKEKRHFITLFCACQRVFEGRERRERSLPEESGREEIGWASLLERTLSLRWDVNRLEERERLRC